MKVNDDGSTYCYGCKKTCKDIIEFYMELHKATMTKALYFMYHKYIEELISMRYYWKWHTQLKKGNKPHEYLINRGVSRKIMLKYLLGYDSMRDRITVPIFNEWGYCVNARMIKYRGDRKDFKVVSFKKGMGKCRLFPLVSLIHKEVYLFEGEIDTLIALSTGLNAVTMTAGASSWRTEFTHLFKDKIVYLCLDNDEAGQGGAKYIAKELEGVASEVFNVIIPKKYGKDFSDFLEHKPILAFFDLVNKARKFEASDLMGIKRKRREIDAYAQQETFITDFRTGKDKLVIIARIERAD